MRYIRLSTLALSVSCLVFAAVHASEPRPGSSPPLRDRARPLVQPGPDPGGDDRIRYLLAQAPASSPARGEPAKKPAASSARAVRSRAREAYDDAAWADCAKLYAAAARDATRRRAAGDFYDAACCAALAGQADVALEHLLAAVDGGYRDVQHLQRDPDLASLHDDPRWKKIVRDAEANRRHYRSTINTELLEIYEQDQADRRGEIDWSVVAPRDEQRRRRVIEILAAGGAKTSDDYRHAAMVFQHGDTPEDALRAHELALEAVELDPSNGSARWLAAAAQDRYLMRLGKPQRYGTQYQLVDGRWVLYEVDPTVTDEERAKWNVPPLAEARRRAERMNE